MTIHSDSPVVETVVSRRSQLGEGAFWDPRVGLLYWVDILGQKVCAYDPGTSENREWEAGALVGTVVPTQAGDLLLARDQDVVRLDLGTGATMPFAVCDPRSPDLRFNDGKCDPAGRLWVGTMELSAQPDAGALYCLDPQDGVLTTKVSPATISNGIVWSLDHRLMYYIDSKRNDVRVWDYAESTGEIENERVAFGNEGAGVFDGMTIDADGKLWIAIFGAGEVRCYDPATGLRLQTLSFPASCITSCAFGGADLRDLYATSCSEGYGPEDWTREPQAGSLFRVRPGATGVVLPYFAG